MGYYKNISGNYINVKLFGIAPVIVPAEAACVEIDDAAADAVNGLVFPNRVLERVYPTIVAPEDAPIVRKSKKAKEPVKEEDEDFFALEIGPEV